MLTFTFYRKRLNTNFFSVRYFIGVELPDGTRVEVFPGRNARRDLRNFVIREYGSNVRFKNGLNKPYKVVKPFGKKGK